VSTELTNSPSFAAGTVGKVTASGSNLSRRRCPGPHTGIGTIVRNRLKTRNIWCHAPHVRRRALNLFPELVPACPPLASLRGRHVNNSNTRDSVATQGPGSRARARPRRLMRGVRYRASFRGTEAIHQSAHLRVESASRPVRALSK
jgi:hypothetical protein